MKWIIKAVIQKAISFLPNATQVNYFFQKNVTKGVHLSDAYLEDKLIHFKKHLTIFDQWGAKETTSVLEIGTGWYPIIPVCLFLSGFGRITTFDIYPWLTQNNVLLTLHALSKHIDTNPNFWSGIILDSRLKILKNLLVQADKKSKEELLEDMNIFHVVKRNASLTDLQEEYDFIVSNNVLEHILPETMESMFQQLKEIIRKDGLMSHFIDMSDHFAHFDKSISIYNFLQFSDWQWKFIDNSIQPQNRWRMVDYISLFQSAGFMILFEEFRPGQVEEVQKIKLARKFAGLSPEALAISHCYIGLKVEKN